MRKYRSAIVGLLVSATIALAFIQIDDTHVQTVLTGAIKTFQDAIRFQATGGGSEYVGIVGPAVVNTPSVTYKLPQNDGATGQALVTDGSANLAWASVAGATPTPQPTATPLAFGTPGVLAAFNATELGSYAGASCPTPTDAVSAISSTGSVSCVSVSGSGTTGCGTAANTDVTYWTDSTHICGNSNFTFDYTNGRIQGQNLTSSQDGTIPMVNFVGTMNGAPTGTSYGLVSSLVAQGNNPQIIRGSALNLGGNYFGDHETSALLVQGSTRTTGINISPNWTNTSNWDCDQSGSGKCGNIGIAAYAYPDTRPTPAAGDQIGVFGTGAFSTGSRDVGGYFKAAAPDAATHIGVLATAANSTQGTHLKNVPAYFSLADGLVDQNISAVQINDSGTTQSDIFRGYDQSILVFQIASTTSGASDGFKFQDAVGTGTGVPGIVTMSSIGGDTNVDISIAPKGGGFVTSTTALMPVAAAVGSLPTCDSTRKGARSTATDCNAVCTFTGTCTTGGSTVCPMYCDGSAWKEG